MVASPGIEHETISKHTGRIPRTLDEDTLEHHTGSIYCTMDMRIRENIDDGGKTYEGDRKSDAMMKGPKADRSDHLNAWAYVRFPFVIVLTCLSRCQLRSKDRDRDNTRPKLNATPSIQQFVLRPWPW